MAASPPLLLPMHLLDVHMPHYSRRVRHATFVRADHETVAGSIERVNLTQSSVLRVLFERCSPERCSLPRNGAIAVTALAELGFVLFRSSGGAEIAVGAMWMPTERGLERVAATAAGFCADASCATRILIHFGVSAAGVKHSTLAIETRLETSRGAGAVQALAHWDAFHRLGAVARRDVLLAIKQHAESCAKSGSWD